MLDTYWNITWSRAIIRVNMETIELVLSIVASIASITAVVMSVSNKKEINKIKGKIKSGDNSVNTVGNQNRINNG